MYSFCFVKADGTLDLTGQFLALPVVNCDNQEQISTPQNSGMVIHGELVTSISIILNFYCK
jgi:hypothetical protein